MNESLAKREQILPEVKQEILRAISKGYVNTAEDIAEIFPVSEQEAIELLNDDEFYLQIANGTRAKMRMLYNTKGVDVLERLLDSKESKDNIAAYDRLAKATGGIQEEKQGVNNFNFFNIEDLILSDTKRSRAERSEDLLEAKEKREKTIDLPKTEFNRVKNSKTTSRRETEVNGNIFEQNPEEDLEYDLDGEIEAMFEESEELEFDEDL